MKKIHIIMAVIAAVTALGCNKNTSVPPVQTDEIVFTASDHNLEYNVETKASVVSSLSSFKASAVTGTPGTETAVWTNISYADSDGDSKFTGDKYWPLTNANPYSFYASNIDLTFSAAGNTVSASNETDVVCAYLASPTYKDVNALTFQHIFARIGSMTVNAVDGYTISNVSISVTPKVSGTYNLRTGFGQTDGTGWSGTANGSATGIANSTPGTKANDIYTVPGVFTLTATWTATRGEYVQTFSNKSYDVSIVGGKVNNISTTLGGLAEEIKFTVSVAEWGTNSVTATFPMN